MINIVPSGVCNNCILFNARSLKNKLFDFHHVLSRNYDVVCVTESWLNESVTDAMIDNSGNFNIYRCDRINHQGGGVLALVSKNYSSYQVPLPAKFSKLELVAFDIVGYQNSTRFILTYRSPDINLLGREYSALLIECLEYLQSVTYSVIILGDLNLPLIDWQLLSAPTDNIHDVFLNFCLHNGFYQFVDEPTRGNSCLDIVLSNDQCIISSLTVTEPFCTSDHCSVEFSSILQNKAMSNNHARGTDVFGNNFYPDFDRADYDSISWLTYNHPFHALSSE